MAKTPTDPVDLTARLVRCASITPNEGGALALLADLLSAAGFSCTRVDRGGVSNLFARWGARGHARSFGFNGHTDVVPPGDAATWRFPPFSAEIAEDHLWGRGAVDMKSGVAAFVAAAIDRVREAPPEGAILLAITGDEEGDATDGTLALLDWMKAEGEAMSLCLVGEPTSRARFGDMVKIGRRGSMTVHFTASGVQGHTAYPDRGRNAAAAMVRLMTRLAEWRLDEGTRHFDASTLAVTTIDTGNPASNVIPASATATVNVRFNDAHHSADIADAIAAHCAAVMAETGVRFETRVKVSGESFIVPPGALCQMVTEAIAAECGMMPELSTTGGTSDARFVRAHCPVIEFGLVGQTMHQIDERVEVAQIGQLKSVYRRILDSYFA